MALVSPGISITVTDESQYISNAVGTVPLVLLATAQNKTINGALATGTTKANAGKLQIFGSQRELTTAMGTPTFQQTSAGTPLHGNELNEYGLMASYSALGLGNQLYAVRADIDLNELQGTSVRPTSAVANGTYWFDTTDTTWGIYEWSLDTQSFSVQSPIVITDITQTTSANSQGSLTGGSGYVYTPISSVGSVGSYAVVVSDPNGDNRTFYKAGPDIGTIDPNSLRNKWLLVGTPNWIASAPTIKGTVTNPVINTIPYTYGNLSINSTPVNIVVASSTVTTLAANINAAAISGVTADVVNGQLALYSTGTQVTIGTSYNGTGNTALLTAVGLSSGTYNPLALQTYGANNNTVGYGSFSAVPPWTNTVSGDINAPSRSVWLKQGATGGGANFVFKEYNSTTGLWATQAVTSYPTLAAALYGLDPIGGGANIGVGTIVMRQDPNPTGSVTLGYAGYAARVRTVSGAVSATGTATAPNFGTGQAFTIKVTQPGTTTIAQATVTIGTAFGGTYGNNKDFVAAVLGANLPNVTALVNSNGTITLTHTAGGDISLSYSTGTNPAITAGFASNGTASVSNIIVNGTGINQVTTITGFANLVYTYSNTQPVADPVNGTLWYYSDPTQVDIMINTGTAWVGYQTGIVDARGYSLAYGTLDPTGVIVAAAAPTTQTDNSVLAKGDLWLNTSDLENWPALSRWNGSNWVAIDNTDHISTNGIIFADARWDTGGYLDAASGTEATVQQLMQSNYLDLDAPNPLLYPRGMLMLNTRRSGYNVKKYVTNYFNTATFNVSTYSSSTTYGLGAQVTTNGTAIYVSLTTGNLNHQPAVDGNGNPTASTYWAPLATSTWVTASGLNTTNETPYAGHYAQRQIVVAAMKAALDANTEIREDQFKFSLICAPGYPELISDMVSLNNDRANTAFVIGDTPMGLDTNAVDLINWSNDTNGNGLATADPYLAVYYPSGLSSDLAGNTIMVPPSHMVLRTYLYNDNVSYPWFAPAGTRRGLVSNATDLGYVDYVTGEFVRTGVNQALRDTLYQNKINPITIIPGIGLVVWGQKTRDPNSESMDRVNVARLVNYIRTIFASSGNAFLFEPNDKITRDQFAAVLNRALNDLVAKRGIYDYLVVCDTTNNTPDRIANNQLYADVAIEPEKAVEFIYIPIRLFNPGDIANLGGK